MAGLDLRRVLLLSLGTRESLREGALYRLHHRWRLCRLHGWDQRFCFPIPDFYGDAEAAPLLCAGLIGYRSLARAGDGKRLGIYGFGAAAHIVAQVAHYQNREIYAFT